MSRLLTDAILDVFTAASLRCGDGQAPQDDTLPYSVLYPLPSPIHDGDLAEPDRQRSWLYQVTSVGGTREQAQWQSDEATAALQSATLTPSGLSVMRIEVDTRGGVTRDDSADRVEAEGGVSNTRRSLFYAVDLFLIHTTS